MTKKKYRVTVDLDEQEYKELTTLKNKLDRSISWLGRKAISDFINKNTRTSFITNRKSVDAVVSKEST